MSNIKHQPDTPFMPFDLKKAIPYHEQISHSAIGITIKLLDQLWKAERHWLVISYADIEVLRFGPDRGKGRADRYIEVNDVLSSFWWHSRDRLLHSPYILELIGKPTVRAPIPSWMKKEALAMAETCLPDCSTSHDCHYCGCSLGNDYHFDHALPISRGGFNHPRNLRACCPTCNFSKRMMTEAEFGIRPLSPIHEVGE